MIYFYFFHNQFVVLGDDYVALRHTLFYVWETRLLVCDLEFLSVCLSVCMHLVSLYVSV